MNDTAGTSADTDVLKFTGINASDITISRTTADLLITIDGTGDQITIKDQFKSTINYYRVEQVVFGDSSTWDMATLNGKAWFRGGSGDDTLTGTTAADSMDGGGGNDTISANSGVDRIIGGSGNDQLTRGSGNDVFVFSGSFGADAITDFAGGTGVADQLEISMGTAFDTTAEVLAVTTVNGSGSLITFDASHVISLNVAKSTLNSNDFIFV